MKDGRDLEKIISTSAVLFVHYNVLKFYILHFEVLLDFDIRTRPDVTSSVQIPSRAAAVQDAEVT